MNDIDRNYTDMNDTLQNGDVIIIIVFLNNHTLSQDIQPRNLNDMDISVDKGCFNGDYFYMNSSTVSVIKNHNSIDYTKKMYEISTNR